LVIPSWWQAIATATAAIARAGGQVRIPYDVVFTRPRK
jgi:hypothetical protein